ncbi:MAG: hypothetical protein KAH57_11770 [Thermoplasmata archaeon]|nr:hypothetical protein [Thermoplasmata archaeon]
MWDPASLISVGKITIISLVLIGASIMDLKYRRVPDKFWLLMLLGAGGLVLWEMYLRGGDEAPLSFMSLLLLVGTMLFVMFGYPELGEVVKGNRQDIMFLTIYVLAGVGGAVGFLFGDRAIFGRVFFSFIFMLAYFAMYSIPFLGVRVLHGGADAKCMIALAALFPWYGEIDVITMGPFYDILGDVAAMEYVFPFHLSAMLNAAVITVVIMGLYMPIRNAASGYFGLKMFSGYYVNVDRLKGKHVWVVLEDKEKKKVDPTDKVIERLRRKKVKRAWCSPKIPFIVSIAVGFVVQAVVGNLVMILFLMF